MKNKNALKFILISIINLCIFSTLFSQETSLFERLQNSVASFGKGIFSVSRPSYMRYTNEARERGAFRDIPNSRDGDNGHDEVNIPVPKGGAEEKTVRPKNEKIYCRENQNEIESILDDKKIRIEDIPNSIAKREKEFIYRLTGWRKITQSFPPPLERNVSYEKELTTIVQLMPDKLLGLIRVFNVYSDPYTNNIASAVISPVTKDLKLDNSKFMFLINYSNFTNDRRGYFNKVETVIHESGHIINHRDSQRLFDKIGFGLDSKKCLTPNVWDGLFCFPPDKIYALFYNEYCKVRSTDLRDYVSKYAMKACHEDFAETFTHYVLETDFGDKKNTKALGKINFFYLNEYSDIGDDLKLKEIKDDFRTRIGNSPRCKEVLE